jgi:competence protein ComGC
MNKIRKILKSKKGSAIFQMIIVIAIVAILAVTTLPNLSSQIEAQGTKAIDKIDTVGSTLDE